MPQESTPAPSSRQFVQGQKVGRWTLGPKSGHKILCTCDCGKSKLVDAYRLANGNSKSCGRCNCVPFVAGQKFGRWIVLEPVNQSKPLCECDCGTIRSVYATNLRRRLSTGCGCKNVSKRGRHFVSHGLSSSREYTVWLGIISRCEDPKNKGFKNYGGRGIRVCARWRNSFVAFLDDMGLSPGSEFSIDRYPDNDGDYEPGNTRWATDIQQARNNRRNHLLEFDGQKRTIAEWAEITGIRKGTIRYRIMQAGWTVDQALTAPVVDMKYKKNQHDDM